VCLPTALSTILRTADMLDPTIGRFSQAKPTVLGCPRLLENKPRVFSCSEAGQIRGCSTRQHNETWICNEMQGGSPSLFVRICLGYICNRHQFYHPRHSKRDTLLSGTGVRGNTCPPISELACPNRAQKVKAQPTHPFLGPKTRFSIFAMKFDRRSLHRTCRPPLGIVRELNLHSGASGSSPCNALHMLISTRFQSWSRHTRITRLFVCASYSNTIWTRWWPICTPLHQHQIRFHIKSSRVGGMYTTRQQERSTVEETSTRKP